MTNMDRDPFRTAETRRHIEALADWPIRWRRRLSGAEPLPSTVSLAPLGLHVAVILIALPVLIAPPSVVPIDIFAALIPLVWAWGDVYGDGRRWHWRYANPWIGRARAALQITAAVALMTAVYMVVR